jgi:hypothetical protein
VINDDDFISFESSYRDQETMVSRGWAGESVHVGACEEGKGNAGLSETR